MEYAKATTGQCYDCIAVGGTHRLWLHHDDTIEGVKADIDYSNERAVAKGYKAESWVITKVEWTYLKDKDGNFVEKTHRERAIEVYPPISK